MGRKQSDRVWAPDPSLDKDGRAPHSKHWIYPLSGTVGIRERTAGDRELRRSKLPHHRPRHSIYNIQNFNAQRRRRRPRILARGDLRKRNILHPAYWGPGSDTTVGDSADWISQDPPHVTCGSKTSTLRTPHLTP